MDIRCVLQEAGLDGTGSGLRQPYLGVQVPGDALLQEGFAEDGADRGPVARDDLEQLRDQAAEVGGVVGSHGVIAPPADLHNQLPEAAALKLHTQAQSPI